MDKNYRVSASRIMQTYSGYYAGFVSRLIATIIDITIEIIVVILATKFLIAIRSIFELDLISIYVFSFLPGFIDFVESIFSLQNMRFFSSLLYFFFFFLYNAFFWSFSGHTPGKYIMGLKVISQDGQKISFIKAIIRYLGYFISIIPFGFGFIWIIFDSKRMAFHDKIAKTYVVYMWDARPDENFLVETTKRWKK
jgi:uncharacterized RDD family membrane protein YckC